MSSLQATKLTRQFGGLLAVNEVSLTLRKGCIHAIIGPNGAGKSTLINLLSGDLPASSGTVTLDTHTLTGMHADAVTRAGVGRSYQKTNIFLPLTVWENVRLAAQGRRQHALVLSQLWRKATQDDALNAAAMHALALCELAHLRERIAAELSHGEQRQLEIALCLAGKPQVLLLDEPLAGMGAEEAERMVSLLKRLKAEHAILLIEHDMDAVFSLADELTVMVNGSVIATGTPHEVRNNAQVQAAYLGEGHDV